MNIIFIFLSQTINFHYFFDNILPNMFFTNQICIKTNIIFRRCIITLVKVYSLIVLLFSLVLSSCTHADVGPMHWRCCLWRLVLIRLLKMLCLRPGRDDKPLFSCIQNRWLFWRKNRRKCERSRLYMQEGKHYHQTRAERSEFPCVLNLAFDYSFICNSQILLLVRTLDNVVRYLRQKYKSSYSS